ncbi:hypothetical protein [Williamsia sp. Leaf354]|uniref:hypothetical protein n=1 Tax=Williamsia sp. Leaf354 TaxID=1736349 RepID=UPI0012E33010|nr:hypothetical protein [Williamsia sp. Leaf354]
MTTLDVAVGVRAVGSGSGCIVAMSVRIRDSRVVGAPGVPKTLGGNDSRRRGGRVS